MPFRRSSGPSNTLSVWSKATNSYEIYKYYESYSGGPFDHLHNKSKDKQKQRAQETARYLRSEGHKARVKSWSNTIGDYSYVVYWIEKVEK